MFPGTERQSVHLIVQWKRNEMSLGCSNNETVGDLAKNRFVAVVVWKPDVTVRGRRNKEVVIMQEVWLWRRKCGS